MKTSLKNSLGFLLVHFCFQVLAQEASFLPVKNVDELKAKFKTAHQNTQTLKSQFVQEKHLSFMQDKTVSKGIFMLKREQKMRIEYTSPFAYLVIINGDKLYIKDGKKTTKIDTRSDKSFRQLNEVFMHSLKGDLENVKGFHVTYFEGKELYKVELIPTEEALKGLYNKINVFLDRQSLQLSRLDLSEKSGDITKMRFEQTQTNIDIPDATFVVR